jgi:NADP-dependent 3-hydroxy acid dehydrogenase YdfG
MNIMKNIALITGGTGGIGGACVKILHELGWELYLPVRNIKTAGYLLDLPDVHVEELDFTDQQKINTYCLHLAGSVSNLSLVLLTAGGRGPKGEFYDKEFPGENIAEQRKNAIAGHMEANVYTKERILNALVGSYGGELKKTVLEAIGSHAADFSLELALSYDEVGYSQSMLAERILINNFEKFFHKAILDEPGLVETNLTTTKLQFALDDPKNKKQTKEEYSLELLVKTGLV